MANCTFTASSTALFSFLPRNLIQFTFTPALPIFLQFILRTHSQTMLSTSRINKALAKDAEDAPQPEAYLKTVLRVCSYHRRDLDLAVIRTRPHEMDRLRGRKRDYKKLRQNYDTHLGYRTSLEAAFGNPPVAGLGVLDKLAPELLSMVLRNFDVQTYFRFRQVNRLARFVASTEPEYVAVSKHALEAMRALLRSRLAHKFTIPDLYRTLTTPDCTVCGAFGGFVFLFDLTRSCFICVRKDTGRSVLDVATLSLYTKIPEDQLNQLMAPLILRTVPGAYSHTNQKVERPSHLIAQKDAIQVLRSRGLIDANRTHHLLNRKEPPALRLMAATVLPCYDATRGEMERGISCKGCFMVPQRRRMTPFSHQWILSKTAFHIHFLACPPVQALWEHSGRGTRPVKEPVGIRKRGFLSYLGEDGLPR